jgi:hypothetical protein
VEQSSVGQADVSVADVTAAGPAGSVVWRSGRVRSLDRSWTGTEQVTVELTDSADPGGAGGSGQRPAVTALAFTALVGRPEPGDRVLLTTGALDRSLGTGGFALVAALPDRLPVPQASPGHLVKARYTPLQVLVQGADEQGSAHHEALRDADDLAGLPVVVTDLHSALPAVVAGVRTVLPDARVAYLMTDGGALAGCFSRTVDGLRSAGWLTGCVTAGQAFGGDLESVTVHTGLLAAHLVWRADVVVVAQGPGNLGTGTRWGFSGVAAGEAINATAVLGGRPVAGLRVSQADPRPRHRGVSHHSLTAYGRVALAPADVVVPVLDGPLGQQVRDQAQVLGSPTGRHRLVEVGTDGLIDALDGCPVPLSTMGRGLADDPAAFLAAAAGGVHAGRLVRDARPGG